MKPEDILKKIKNKNFIFISADELKNLLSAAKVIEEHETHISGMVRLLQLDDKLLIQEKTDKDELLIRLMKTKEEADYFIKERLEIYDKMWDGCGCKVDYYN